MVCSPIIILNAGCLDKEVIELQCKGPEEVVYYQFSLANRIGDQTLLEVNATSNADDVIISNIEVNGPTFRCLIAGGTIYHNVGIHFVAKTSCGETRTFNAVLPIRPEGALSILCNNGVVIMGNTGAQGIQGERGETGDKGAVGEQGIQGIKGDTGQRGLQGIQGEQGKQGKVGAIGPQGVPGQKGDVGNIGPQGPAGQNGTSYVNDGTIDLNVKSVELGTYGGLSPNGQIVSLNPTSKRPAIYNEKDSKWYHLVVSSSSDNVPDFFTKILNTRMAVIDQLLLSAATSPFTIPINRGNGQPDVNLVARFDASKAIYTWSDSGNYQKYFSKAVQYQMDGAFKAYSIVLNDKSEIINTSILRIGEQSYDKVTKRPCWWDGEKWSDAMGNPLN